MERKTHFNASAMIRAPVPFKLFSLLGLDSPCAVSAS